MANKNFVVQHGLTVGPLTIDAATGDINTSGNVVITGNLGVSQIAKNDSSVSITDTGSGSSVTINIDNVTEHTIDADGVSLASGDRYAIDGTSVLNATTLGANVVNSSLTTVGNLTSLSVAGATTVYGNLTVTNIDSNIIPATDAIYQLGSDSRKWANVYATNLTGTIQTASQPNITAVGNLTSLSASGTIQTTGDVSATNLIGNIQTASQANITTVGNLTSLSVSGATTQYGAATINNTLGVTGNITVGSGSAAGVVTSKGSYDLTLTTNDTGASAPKITLVQSDDGNIQLDPSGTGVVTALSHLYVGNGSTEANISSFGAYDLVLSTNRDLGRATIKLSAGTDGNIDVNLNGSGTVNIPKITFGGGGTQTKAAIIGGSDTYIQYNSGGDFGGSANLTFNDVTNQITVGGAIVATTDDATALAIALG